MRNTYLFGFATFGHPNDYRQSPFKSDSDSIARSVKIFDLSNAIKIFPNSTLFSVRKESIDGIVGISYAIYTYAKEMTSTREGTFIGSSILFTNEIAEENLTIEKLNSFHSILVEHNTTNGILKVNHSKEFSHSKEFLVDFENIANFLKPITELENFSYSNTHIVIFSRTDPDTLKSHFQRVLVLLNKFDTVFFTDNKEIIDYCRNRNIYSLSDENGFEHEVAKVLKEREQKILNSISEFDREKQKLQLDKESILSDLKSQIESNRKNHVDNERILKESESKIERIIFFYSEFSKKIDEYANQLKSGRKLEDVRKLYSENKRIFIESVANEKQPQFVKKLNKVAANSNLQPDNRQLPNQNPYQPNDRKQEKIYRKTRLDVYKITTFIFALLWLVTLLFLLWPKSNEDTALEGTSEEVSMPPIDIQVSESVKIADLIPLPNSILNGNDLKSISKVGIKNKAVKEIVENIFKKNPTDIATYYEGQKEIYEKVLISRNSNCFQDSICKCDSLEIVPSFKK
jgi:hypothetical protein